VGTVVAVEAVKEGLLIRPVSQPKMTLEEKLKAFDPSIHGGEVMADAPVGAEVFW
jgi:antitoxin MazE